MAIRAFRLPADLDLLVDLIPRTFQYPENPEWDIQADEVESFVDTMQTARRIWPLFRLMQALVPPLRDILRGFVWEEDGQAVGVTNVLRMGNTDRWLIGNVSVLPEYRRRGIARKLVQASVDFARERGAKSIVLDVVSGNVPAYELYVRLGFEHFASNNQLDYESGQMPGSGAAPERYRVEPQHLFDWKPRFELAQRITPPGVCRYTPVEEGLFRQPAVVRLVAPVLRRAAGITNVAYAGWNDSRQDVVAVARGSARRRKGGVNELSVMLDPAHASVGPFLLRRVLRIILQQSPGRRIELCVPGWQDSLLAAALDVGFVKRLEYHSLGMIVEQR